MPKFKGWRHVLWTAPLTVAIAAPAVVHAQAEPVAIDEIVVTARKREETLQDVPLPVTAITADQIKLGGIKSVEDAIQLDPSLNFDQGFAPSDTRIVIRGLSPTRGRPNVATLIDGIDVSSESVGIAGGSLLVNPKLLDIERIEVVKGPQSALYGRSAFAGAVQYVTKDPAREFEADVAAEFGNYGAKEYRAEVSAPIIDDVLGFRVVGLKYERDGFYRNFVTGNRVGGQEGEGVAASFKFTPTDSLDFKLRYEYSHDAFQQSPQASLGPNGMTRGPENASMCAPVPGPILDATCATASRYQVATNPDGTAGAISIVPGGQALPYRLEQFMGGLGIFHDMEIPTYAGSVGDGAGRRVQFSPDFGTSTDGGITGRDFPGSDRNVNRVSFVGNWHADYGTFTSLSGYTDARVSTNTDLDHYAVVDADGNDVSAIQQTLDTFDKTWQFSQELRFTSDLDGPVNFIAGAQYWQERVHQSLGNYTLTASGTRCMSVFGALDCDPPRSTPVGPWIDDLLAIKDVTYIDREIEHRSGYLQVTWQINDAWSASVEGRYVDEDNTVTGPDPLQLPGEPGTGPGSVSICGSSGPCDAASIPNGPRGFEAVRPVAYRTFTRNDSYVTPRVNLDWRVTDDALLYLSYSEGQKPGGFATVTIGSTGMEENADAIEFDPEKLKQYELGWKTAWLDRSLLFNGSFFFIDFTDKQVGTQELRGDVLAPVVKNAGGAEIKGLELQAQYRPIRELTLAAAYTYLDAEYTDYVVESSGAPEIGRVGNCDLYQVAELDVAHPTDPSLNQYIASPVCRISRTGNQMEDTPEHAFSAQVGWRQALGNTGFDWFTDLTGRFQSKRYIEDDNMTWLDSYWLADLRVGVDSDTWTIVGFVDNLFDDDTIKSAGTGPGISQADFRLGGIVPGGGVAQGEQKSVIPSPRIPALMFVSLPDPRTYRVQVTYKFR